MFTASKIFLHTVPSTDFISYGAEQRKPNIEHGSSVLAFSFFVNHWSHSV